MPRKRNLSPPSYCLHKASGRAVVRIEGRDHYLGRHGSSESHAEYERLIIEWRTQRAGSSTAADQTLHQAIPPLTIAEILLRYRAFAQGYYVKNGVPTKEFVEMRLALRPLRKLYGSSVAREFGPLALKSVRQHMVDSDLSRGVVNNRMNRIKRFFKWAVGEELVPPSVYEGLRAVVGLKYGRTEARETEPVKPVDDAHVDAVIPFMAPQVAALVQFQRLTGMRPCEAVMVRACDIDMGGDVWIYEPHDHKMAWRGFRRQIPIGPRTQAILRPFLKPNTEAYLFSPRDAEAHRNAIRREKENLQ